MKFADDFIDLKFNNETERMIEDLKEYIELKFVELNLTNDKYMYYIKERKYVTIVEMLIMMRGLRYEHILGSLYIDIDFSNKKCRYKFTNYIKKMDKFYWFSYNYSEGDRTVIFDKVNELKKHIDKMIEFYIECFK